MQSVRQVFVFSCLISLSVAVGAADREASYDIGVPVRFLEGCETDLDADSREDVALLFENATHTVLIALIQRDDGYTGHTLLRTDPSSLHLACRYGSELVGTKAGSGNGVSKIITVDGAYLVLQQPESSRVAFYWNAEGFEQIWLAD